MKTQIQTNVWLKAAFMATLLVVADSALAAGGLSGGISQATSAAGQIRDGLLAIGGIVAVIYLLYKAVQAWGGRCDWGEFGMSVLYVALAGGAATLADWAWKALK